MLPGHGNHEGRDIPETTLNAQGYKRSKDKGEMQMAGQSQLTKEIPPVGSTEPEGRDATLGDKG